MTITEPDMDRVHSFKPGDVHSDSDSKNVIVTTTKPATSAQTYSVNQAWKNYLQTLDLTCEDCKGETLETVRAAAWLAYQRSLNVNRGA